MSLKGLRMPFKSRQVTRTITKDEFRLPDDAESGDIEGQDGFAFSRAILIPQSLKHCLQTVDALGVKIRHSLSFNVQMHNPDGHVSEVGPPEYFGINPNQRSIQNSRIITYKL